MSRDAHLVTRARRGTANRLVLILLDTLKPAERRDLANALLRTAWSASLEETRVLLLDVVTATDAAAMWEAGG